MSFNLLKQYQDLIAQNEEVVLEDWLHHKDVQDIFIEHDIDAKFFKENYARNIFAYYMGVIDGSTQIGDCPVMGEYLDFLYDKNVMPDQLFMICTYFRKSLMHLSFNTNIISLELYDELSYIIDHNLKGVLERFRKIIFDKDQAIETQSQLLVQYKVVIDEGFIVSMANLSGEIIYVNDKFCTVSGYEEEELLGNHYSMIKHRDTDPDVFKSMWDTLLCKHSWQGILQNRKKNGDSYYVQTHITPILDTSGNIVDYFSISHDLTEVFMLQNELVQTQKEIIFRLSELSESRSQEAGNHIKRVAGYAKHLASLLNLDQKSIDDIYFASPMHDIGKIGIPDSILMKAGPLSEDEWKTMKTHSEIGYEIFKDSKRSILQAAATISHEHHEKFDGSGYPRGIRNDEIHIYARIVTIADVFDALATDRVYKKAWSFEDIIALFKEEKGKHFDPEIVEVFLDNLDDFIEIKANNT
ncbi:HD domain-containing phosphohydrolase [Sulfurimonas sp.]|uniref:HD domain-containing phosphohydrolase n=1 Tax=Sulfurimonas sp. TaxID=2022749 RepID=UPI0039E56DBC